MIKYERLIEWESLHSDGGKNLSYSSNGGSTEVEDSQSLHFSSKAEQITTKRERNLKSGARILRNAIGYVKLKLTYLFEKKNSRKDGLTTESSYITKLQGTEVKLEGCVTVNSSSGAGSSQENKITTDEDIKDVSLTERSVQEISVNELQDNAGKSLGGTVAVEPSSRVGSSQENKSTADENIKDASLTESLSSSSKERSFNANQTSSSKGLLVAKNPLPQDVEISYVGESAAEKGSNKKGGLLKRKLRKVKDNIKKYCVYTNPFVNFGNIIRKNEHHGSSGEENNNSITSILKEFESKLDEELKPSKEKYESSVKEKDKFHDKDDFIIKLRDFTYKIERLAHLNNLFVMFSSFFDDNFKVSKHVSSETSPFADISLQTKEITVPFQCLELSEKVMNLKTHDIKEPKLEISEKKKQKKIKDRLTILKKKHRGILENFCKQADTLLKRDDQVQKLKGYFEDLRTHYDPNNINEFDLLLPNKIQENLKIISSTQLSTPARVKDQSLAMKKKTFMRKIWNKITKKFKDLPNEKVHSMRTRSLYAVIALSTVLMIACNDDPIVMKFCVGVMMIALLALCLENYYYKLYGVDKSEVKKVPTSLSHSSPLGSCKSMIEKLNI